MLYRRYTYCTVREEPRPFGPVFDTCCCAMGEECQGCKLVNNIPARKDLISTQGRVRDEGYPVDDCYTCTRQTQDGANVNLEVKRTFQSAPPISLPHSVVQYSIKYKENSLFDGSFLSILRSKLRLSLHVSYVCASQNEPKQNPDSKRQRRSETWRGRLFSSNS